MASKKQIVKFLNDYLDVENIKDYGYNGLQVDGKEDVKKVGFAVDACLASFKDAVGTGCDMLIVHHGLFWDKIGPITNDMYQRIKVLMDNDVSLLGYHAPLDKHPVVGNNAEILKLFSVANKKEFGSHNGVSWGFVGSMKSPKSLVDVSKIIQNKIGDHDVLNFGNKQIKTIACVSGGAAFAIPEAAEKADLLIIGEMKHGMYHVAKELEINVIAAGHYQTEVFGVQALMGLLEKKYRIKTEFLNNPTGY